MKAIAFDSLKVPQTMVLIFGRVENIVVKGENAGYHHFLLLP